MQKFFPVLRQCQLFSGIAENDLLAMLRCLNVTVQQYRKGQTLIAEGEKPEKFGIVLSGAVQLWRIDYSGNRSIMASVAPSQIFGESFVCAEADAIPIQVVASEPCEIMLIDGSRILHACGNGCDFHHQVIFNLLKITGAAHSPSHLTGRSWRTFWKWIAAVSQLRSASCGKRASWRVSGVHSDYSSNIKKLCKL